MHKLGNFITRLFILLSLLAIVTFINCSVPSSLNNGHRKQYFLSPPSAPSVEVYQVKRESVDSENNDIKVHGKEGSTTLQIVNVSKNSDLLFGEVTDRDNALLLHCQAPYSVQWIFRGDSDPEFNTNTTTKVDSSGSNLYSAYLFLGSRRNLNERETGRYICTSVRNKRLSSYLYIYVTKSALFTNKGLETIYYSEGDDSIRIPCSLSEPRAIATLQKSQDGVLKCPMNDSVRFDSKQGFLLNPKRLHQPPEGTYLCIADYNNTFQIIKYNVVKEDGPNSGSGSEQTSDEYDPTTQPPTQQTNPPSIHDPPSTGSNVGCANMQCGKNAYCRRNKKRDAVCRCSKGYTGNPYVECKAKNEMTTYSPPPQQNTDSTTTTYSPPPPESSSSGYPPGSSCETYDDCPNDRACLQNVCQNPCSVNSICGPNTNCETQYHTPFCSCREGFEGDPYSSQQGQQCEKSSYCDPNPCGSNAVCRYVNGIISCSCEPGFVTHNDGTCHPNEKNGPFNPNQIKQPIIPLSRPIIIKNRTSTLSKGKECHYDIDCADDQMCVQDKCGDPCVNACGLGAVCHTRNHFPRCICPEGTTGDPFYKCAPLFSEMLGSSSTTALPQFSQKPSNDNDASTNCGAEQSPCGLNTICQASRGHFVCVCPNFFTGDPYSAQGCTRKSGYLKCDKDADCPHFLTCLRHQGCVNPCNVKNICQEGRSCVPFLHRPACLKTDNLKVNLPRDGLVSDKATDDGSSKDELEISEIPDGLNSTSCFIKSGEKIISPCGKNSICYDESSIMGNNDTLEGKVYCGCMENHTGDPYIACEPLQACTEHSTCDVNKFCDLNGFCRRDTKRTLGANLQATNLTTNITINQTSNPCSPSPCTNSKDVCIITRSNNSARCLPSSKIPVKLKSHQSSSSFLFRSDMCQLTGSCNVDLEDNDATNEGAGDSTTEMVADLTGFPAIATSASYLSSAAVLSSIEEEENDPKKGHLIYNLSYSNETTPPVFNDFSVEDTVVDV